MLNNNNDLKHIQHTGYNNNGIDFIHSVYVESIYFNNFILLNKEDNQISIDDEQNNTKDDTYKDLIIKLGEIVY